MDYPVTTIKGGFFTSLHVSNFRRYICGHFFSAIGMWMQIVALSWLTWRLTRSADWLGFVGFSSRILTLVLGLVGGAVADRFFRGNLIIITQILLLIQALVLAVLSYLGIITPWVIIVLTLFAGGVYAFDFPARMSFVTDIVGKDRVNNAISFTSSSVHGARVIGPAIAGIVVATYGESLCFLINSLTFLSLIIAMLLINKAELNRQPMHDIPMYQSIKEGLSYAWADRKIRKVLTVLAAISIFAMPYYIMVPVFVDKIYGKGSEFFGFLMTASAVGALFGTWFVARKSGAGVKGLRNNIGIGSIFFALFLILFSWIKNDWVGLIMMFLIGLASLVSLVSINSWLQIVAPDHVRGRVMSLFTMMFFGFIPIGSLLMGFLAERIGVQIAVTITSAVCLIFSLWFMFTAKGIKKTS